MSVDLDNSTKRDRDEDIDLTSKVSCYSNIEVLNSNHNLVWRSRIEDNSLGTTVSADVEVIYLDTSVDFRNTLGNRGDSGSLDFSIQNRSN